MRLAHARFPTGGAEIAPHQPVLIKAAQTEDVNIEKPGKQEAACKHDPEHGAEDRQVNVVEYRPIIC